MSEPTEQNEEPADQPDQAKVRRFPTAFTVLAIVLLAV